nr:hypothetical protein CFP56_77835 [Quercus suber]
MSSAGTSVSERGDFSVRSRRTEASSRETPHFRLVGGVPPGFCPGHSPPAGQHRSRPPEKGAGNVAPRSVIALRTIRCVASEVRASARMLA